MDEEKPKKKHKKNRREEYASVTDIETFLSDRIMLRYNVVTRRVEYRLVLSQYGLVCWEELDTMQQKELNKLKAAMTMPSINERSAEEMRSMRNMMACYDPHTDTDDTDDS